MKYAFYLAEWAVAMVALHLFGLAGFALVIAMFVVTLLDENYRGQKTLDRVLTELEQAGDAT